MADPVSRPHVALFTTCLVRLFRPSVAVAALDLLEQAGCRVSIPDLQVCCGQPAYNSGDRDGAEAVARDVIRAFEPFDHIVLPSGSCAGMIRTHFPELFEDEPDMADRARTLAAKTWELTAFLDEAMGVDLSGRYAGDVTFHDACAGLRELKIREQPRRLLGRIDGLGLREASGGEECCGFGGTFCVKYPDSSAHMVDEKLDHLSRTGAGLVLSGDLGCLLNMAGRSRRRGLALRFRHVAEMLAGRLDTPAIGEEAEG